ncbi:hypothetical protein [Arenimonas metalli]|uniref:hypothetical protein n=1 Tax=Arenimonas metalli TaxID=948077 RepID=UPI0012EBFCEC|nr:hypothetical protein [Arenimonas metalli]
MKHTFPHSGRWLWLGALTAFAVLSLLSGKLFLASGLLLLGVFAFYNDPLSPAPSNSARPSPMLAVSWACGLFGITAIIVAGARNWI